MRPTRSKILLLALTLGALAVGPAAADWLVTKDGARVETKGSWKVKGRQVVFTLPNGTLSAMPVDEIDLEKSEKLTALAKQPRKKKKAAEPKKKAVLTITDKDVPKAQVQPEGEAAGGAEGEPPISPPGDEVAVSGWNIDEDSDEDGIVVIGGITNPTQTLATRISLGVVAFDESGQEVGRRYAVLDDGSLNPGGTTRWRVHFPDATSLGTVRFEIRSQKFASNEDDPNATEDPDA